MKKALTILMAFIFIIGLVPVPVNAENKINASEKATIDRMSQSFFVLYDTENINGEDRITMINLMYGTPEETSLSLKDFPYLKYFICEGGLKSLDVSKNTKLESLSVHNGSLKNINLKNNKNLKSLEINDNKLEKLNITKCTKLKDVRCVNNELTNLNITKNKNLKELYCSNNKLKGLNITQNAKLKKLYCENNKITKLNASACPDVYIDCDESVNVIGHNNKDDD